MPVTSFPTAAISFFIGFFDFRKWLKHPKCCTSRKNLHFMLLNTSLEVKESTFSIWELSEYCLIFWLPLLLLVPHLLPRNLGIAGFFAGSFSREFEVFPFSRCSWVCGIFSGPPTVSSSSKDRSLPPAEFLRIMIHIQISRLSCLTFLLFTASNRLPPIGGKNVE